MTTRRSRTLAKWFVRAIEHGLDTEGSASIRMDALDAFQAFGDRPTEAERLFLRRAQERKELDVWRNGWPDFLLQDTDSGRFFAVEVKAGGDSVSIAQRRMFAALEASGLSVFVWNPSVSKRLIPWRTYRSCIEKDRTPFSLTEQADIFAAWKRGTGALRQICERFGTNYDAVANLLAEQDERREYRNSLVSSVKPSLKGRSQ